ncbi:unnamed protein product, partial [Discosporangium mesarthrocarpum]
LTSQIFSWKVFITELANPSMRGWESNPAEKRDQDASAELWGEETLEADQERGTSGLLQPYLNRTFVVRMGKKGRKGANNGRRRGG